jgi:hypothetical protein
MVMKKWQIWAAGIIVVQVLVTSTSHAGFLEWLKKDRQAYRDSLREQYPAHPINGNDTNETDQVPESVNGPELPVDSDASPATVPPPVDPTITSGAGAGPSTGGDDFASAQDALEWIEKNHPYQADGSHWKDALKEPRFDRFQKNLYRQDLDAFYKFKDRVLKYHEFWPGQKDMERIPDSATRDYFCHDFAWRTGDDRKKPVDPSHPLAEGKHINPTKVIADPDQYGFDDFKTIGRLRAGDIVVYFNSTEGKPDHSAVVLKVNPQGVESGHDIYLMSKNVDNSLFKHRLGGEETPDYFYDNFAGKGVIFYRPLPEAQH